MEPTDHTTDLEGRIDGIGQALLRLAAALEMDGLINGPQLSQAWTEARPEHLAHNPVRQASRRTLLQLAQTLDEARQAREAIRSPAHPLGSQSGPVLALVPKRPGASAPA
jgi:hypothetical protein